MFVPWVVIGVAVLLMIAVTAFAVVSAFAWFGIAREHEELLARVKVMQIDVFDLRHPSWRRIKANGAVEATD